MRNDVIFFLSFKFPGNARAAGPETGLGFGNALGIGMGLGFGSGKGLAAGAGRGEGLVWQPGHSKRSRRSRPDIWAQKL